MCYSMFKIQILFLEYCSQALLISIISLQCEMHLKPHVKLQFYLFKIYITR
jgi:hypothetical protein